MFLDAAYAILVEEYVRSNIPLLDAIEQTANMRAGGPAVTAEPEPGTQGAALPSEDQLARQNEAAMRDLQSQMGGLRI